MALEENSQLVFMRASLYSNMSKGSDKLKVRVLPDMVKTPPEDLPIYTMFNKSMVIHGAAEEDTGDPNLSTLLWVLCTPDKLNGFIFSEANVDSYLYTSKDQMPWPYKEFRTHVQRMNLNINSFNYEELKVTFSTQPFFLQFKRAGIKNKFGVDTALTLDIVNIRTGEKWIINSSGTAIYFGQRKIMTRVGSPNMKFSTITQDPTNIYLKADNITLDAQHLCLGHHGMHLCGMQGFLPDNTVSGMSVIPLADITI